MKYFNNNTYTLEEIKKQFLELSLIYHPIYGGSASALEELKKEYHALLKEKHESTTKDIEGEKHTYYYNEQKENEIIEVINNLLSRKLSNIKIMLVGAWLWVGGDTKQHRQVLKELRFFWHSKRLLWYWKPTDSRKFRTKSKGSFKSICEKYGYEEIHA
jgi:hypothetical protein